MMTALEELKSKLPSGALKTDAETLKQYAKDWTTYFDPKASAVVFPKTAEHVQLIVLWARKNKISLVPSGGRTGLSGAAVALHGEVVVSFDQMNALRDFNPVDQTVVCEAGVITENLQKFALEKNLFYPVDFAARGSSQLGGNIATNAGGIKVLRYGLTRDWVAGLKVVTGTGEILELNRALIKNASGYDLRHLMIGSEGTLGFIVEATMHLAPSPPPLKVLVLAASSLDAIMKIFSQFKTKTTLTAFEMFSDKALAHVLHKSPDLSKPFATEAPYYVVAEVECANDSEEEKILKVFEDCVANELVLDGVLNQSEVQAKNFWRLREDISESLSSHSPYKNDLSVRVSAVPAFMQELDQILTREYPHFEVIWFGHIGDGNLHINILRPSQLSKEAFVAECRKVDVMIFDAIKKYAGSISAEHGVGLTKKSFLTLCRAPAEIEIMKGLKRVLDPDGIINPGKIFD